MNRPQLYAAHFGLTQSPFGLTPQPAFFFGGAERENLLRALIHFAEQGEGIALITGEVGAGKTMLLTMLMQDCRQRLPHILPVLINRMMLSPADLAYNLAEQLGVMGDDQELNLQVLQSRIEARLIALFAEGRRTLVVVDEAHALSSQTLEWLRLLTNLETTQGKMLQLMLFGQPELLPRLAQPELRALADRVTQTLTLRGMNRVETEHYVQHRLRQAGFRGESLFRAAAVALIAKHSGGLLRRIHLLADKALLSAYTEHASVVDVHHVQQALAEGIPSAAADKKRPPWYQPSAEPAVKRRQQQWRNLLQWLGAPSGMAWSGLLMLFLLGGSWLMWRPALQATLADLPTAQARPSTMQAVKDETAKVAVLAQAPPPLLHSQLTFQWAQALSQTQALLQQSPTTVAQTFQQHPHGVLFRLISHPASPAQAERWLAKLLQGQAADPQLAAVPLVGYRFAEGDTIFWRVVAVGYADANAAQADLPRWHNLLRQVLPSAEVSIRPITTLLP